MIEPAAAFGTGTHETTGSCMEMLEISAYLALQRNPEASMCDVGCGSGILAITGAKLGLSRVTAIDMDPTAVEATLHNCYLNALADEVEVITGDLDELKGRFDIVAANLDPGTLSANRERLIALSSRYLIISGCPMDQWDGLKEDFKDSRLELIRESLGDEWATGLYEKST
jgi:ribosomal protein L11 methyltransferase